MNSFIISNEKRKETNKKKYNKQKKNKKEIRLIIKWII